MSGIFQFWLDYGSDIASGAVVLSAIAAFAVIITGRQSAKRRNTLDLILHHESDGDLIAARTKFNELKAGETKLATFGKPDRRNSDEAETIRKVLNLHELTAVAIEEGVIDERVFRRWFNGTYVKDYEASKAYLVEARKTFENDRAFIEFERTATRWLENPIRYDSWRKRKKEALVRAWRA